MMKRVLITGAGSYIGTSLQKYLEESFPGQYQTDTLDMQDPGWRKAEFAGYDSVFHVAGIAHSDRGKISAERKKLYYAVNTDLTIETARKARAEGVKQFIFMSSAIVYGDSAPIGKDNVITRETPLSPANCYGNSKVKAEKGIRSLETDSFRVVILRAPMIYGKGSKGNYPLLAKIARRMKVFPYVQNKRSMLYIGNLTEFVRLMIENEERGIFFPQNGEYSNTSELVRLIARANGKKIYLLKGFAWLLKGLGLFTDTVNKAFGSLRYAQDISRYKDFRPISLEESIIQTERS